MDKRTERFELVLTSQEKAALRRVAEQKRLTAAEVLRRLLWYEAARLGLWQEKAETQPGCLGS